MQEVPQDSKAKTHFKLFKIKSCKKIRRGFLSRVKNLLNA